MKYVIIVPDGAADRPIPEIGNKTPLEAAHTTNMDVLAERGMQGLVATIPKGMKPGSEIGNLSLLGYNPETEFTGRAPLEAANLGIELADDEVAFRCNLVTLGDGEMQDYSAGHISTEEATKIIYTLNDEITQVEEDIRFVAGKSYRHLMIIRVRDPKMFTEVQCMPPHDILGQGYKRALPKGKAGLTLCRIMERSQDILKDHPVNRVRVDLGENPANSIWLWGQGLQPGLPLFKDKFGVEGAIISAVDLVNGIGRLAGFKVITVPGATGYYDTNYAGKAAHAIEALNDTDLVYIHIEAPDEASHNGHLEEKIRAIENIDRHIVGAFLNTFDKHADIRYLISPDHPTPIALRTHTADPVPFVMSGKGVATDETLTYNERSAKKQGLIFKNGEDMISSFTNKYM